MRRLVPGVLLATACGGAPSSAPVDAPRLDPIGAAPATTTSTAPLASTAPPRTPSPIPPLPKLSTAVPFEHDDFAGTKARAAAAGELLFVDVWAPWCHTCLSMDAVVFTEPSLKDYAGKLRFAAIDTDRAENDGFVSRFAIDVWPTFLVLEPKTEKVLGYWPGAASLDELRRLLDDALALASPTPPKDPLLAGLVTGKAAQAKRDYRGAVRAYQAVVKRMPRDWARRSETLLLYLHALVKSGDMKGCAALAEKELDTIEGAATPTDFAVGAFRCAHVLMPEPRRRFERRIAERLRTIVARPADAMSVDDRADAYDVLSEVLSGLGDREGARRAQLDRLEVLERAAAEAPSPEHAQVHDWARQGAYLALGRTEAAVALFEQRERELPNSTEPPARLAKLYEQLARPKDALAAIDRALPKSYGPRRLSYLALKARVQQRLGDADGARRTLDEEVRGWEQLGKERNAAALADAVARRKQLGPGRRTERAPEPSGPAL